VGSTERHLSSKWAIGLIGAALFLIMFVGMIRDFLERWHQDTEPRLDGGLAPTTASSSCSGDGSEAAACEVRG
jgi:multisubunit Na+/H+ antiporter MnhG subunit